MYRPRIYRVMSTLAGVNGIRIWRRRSSPPPPPPPPPPPGRLVALPVLALLAISAATYVAGREITPDYYGTALLGYTATDTLPLKAWVATGVLALAIWQLVSALWMHGRLPRVGPAPRRLATAHRTTGVLLVLLTLPVAYHCMRAYGVQTLDARIAVHSIAGSFFYGAVAAKLIVVRSRRLPAWMLPVAGGLLITLVVVLWYTSALWYFNGYSVPLLK